MTINGWTKTFVICEKEYLSPYLINNYVSSSLTCHTEPFLKASSAFLNQLIPFSIMMLFQRLAIYLNKKIYSWHAKSILVLPKIIMNRCEFSYNDWIEDLLSFFRQVLQFQWHCTVFQDVPIQICWPKMNSQSIYGSLWNSER